MDILLLILNIYYKFLFINTAKGFMMNHFAFYSLEQMFIYKKTHSQAGFINNIKI